MIYLTYDDSNLLIDPNYFIINIEGFMIMHKIVNCLFVCVFRLEFFENLKANQFRKLKHKNK